MNIQIMKVVCGQNTKDISTAPGKYIMGGFLPGHMESELELETARALGTKDLPVCTHNTQGLSDPTPASRSPGKKEEEEKQEKMLLLGVTDQGLGPP